MSRLRPTVGERRPAVAGSRLPASTLRELYTDRAKLYLRGEADDGRLDTALNDLRPLDEPRAEPEQFDERVREIVRDELGE